jgi:hypothetical protein
LGLLLLRQQQGLLLFLLYQQQAVFAVKSAIIYMRGISLVNQSALDRRSFSIQPVLYLTHLACLQVTVQAIAAAAIFGSL